MYNGLNFSNSTYRFNSHSFYKSSFANGQKSLGSTSLSSKSNINLNRVPFSGFKSDHYFCDKLN